MKKEKVYIKPLYFDHFEKVIDRKYGFEMTRTAHKRRGQEWKGKMAFLAEIFEGIESLRRVDGQPYFHLSIAAMEHAFESIICSMNLFDIDPHIQTIQYDIHAQPWWRQNDVKKQIRGYVLSLTTRITKGGRFVEAAFPSHDGKDFDIMARDLAVSRIEIIDTRRLANEHLEDSGFIRVIDETEFELGGVSIHEVDKSRVPYRVLAFNWK